MQVRINSRPIGGTLRAIPSKSHAHRLLICAALAGEQTELLCAADSRDISATRNCLTALGADIQPMEGGWKVYPILMPGEGDINCGESGSTFRFLFPVTCALSQSRTFSLEGRLSRRPMDALYDCLEEHGVIVTGAGTEKVSCSGSMRPGRFTIPGDISSQFISGLIFALPLLYGDSEIIIEGKTESRSYIDLTLACVRQFGITVEETPTGFVIPGNQRYISPGRIEVEGDWSNGAFILCGGAISGGVLTLTGMNNNSIQGDREICSILRDFGARVEISGDKVTLCRENPLRAVTVDVGNIPDLVPAVAAVASVAQGETVIKNAGRLRLKESDRLAAVSETLNALGADVRVEGDEMKIIGRPTLKGGTVDSWNDHRIVMMAALCAPACEEPVTVTGAQAVNKSYPGFFNDMEKLGGQTERWEDK